MERWVGEKFPWNLNQNAQILNVFNWAMLWWGEKVLEIFPRNFLQDSWRPENEIIESFFF